MTTFKKLFAALLIAASTQAFAVPTLTVSTVPNPVTAGSTIDLAVMINDVTDLYAYEFTLNFDASLLKANGVTEGSILGMAGATYSDGGVIDNAGGSISFIFNTLLGAVPGASGAGDILHISFDTLGVGSAGLSFSDLLFLDSNLRDIAVTGEDASVDIGSGNVGEVPEPASYLLLGIGLAAAAALRRRQA